MVMPPAGNRLFLNIKKIIDSVRTKQYKIMLHIGTEGNSIERG